MKILIITQKVDKDDSVLGFFQGWIEHLAQHVDEIMVIALSKGAYDLPKNVTVVSLGKEKGAFKITQALRFYFYTFKFLKKSDGVFVHMAPEYVKALYPFNIFYRRPLIMWYAHIKVSQTARWALKKADRILTPSKESFEVDSEKVIATGHGIDTELFTPRVVPPSKPPIILTMSRVSYVKRIHIFIEALNVLKKKYPYITFKALITGKPARTEDTKYMNELKELIKKYKLENHVQWYTELTQGEMPEVYNHASVFVRPQGGGGFGKADLAALACGVPTVLCTTVYNKSLPDFKDDMYFEEDDFEKCADNIAAVLTWSPECLEQYKKEARALVVKNHNLETLSKRIVSEFESLISKKK